MRMWRERKQKKNDENVYSLVHTNMYNQLIEKYDTCKEQPSPHAQNYLINIAVVLSKKKNKNKL